MLKFLVVFVLSITKSYAQVNWSFETDKNKTYSNVLDQKGSVNTTIIKKDKKLQIVKPEIKEKVLKEDLIKKDIANNKIKNLEEISKNKSKTNKQAEIKLSDEKEKFTKAEVIDTKFKKKAINFKKLMKDTLAAQDAVFEAEKNIISQQKSKKVVAGDYLPYLDTEIEGEYHIFDNFRQVPPLDEFDFNLESNWKIFDFGRKNMKYTSADLSIDLARNNLDIVHNSEFARLFKIYLDNTHQTRKLKLIEEYEKILRILEKDIDNRIKGGVGTILEKNQFDQTLTTLTLRKMDANKLYQSAKTDYQLYFTSRFDEKLLPKLDFFKNQMKDILIKVFDIKHLSPDEKKLKLEIKKAYLERKIYESEYYPDVTVGLKLKKYDLYDNDPDFEILGLMTSKMNLFDGFKRHYSAESKFEEISGLSAKLRLTTLQKEQRIMRYEIEYDNLINETKTENEKKLKIQKDFDIAKDMTDLKILTFGERIKFATNILTSELKILENYFQKYEILVEIMKLKGGFTEMFALTTLRTKGSL